MRQRGLYGAIAFFTLCFLVASPNTRSAGSFYDRLQ